MAALARALDDLPAQARRFARWRARRDLALANGRICRIAPLRGGYPYGIRRPGSRRRAHDVDEVLRTVHGLAFWTMERPDTS